MSKYCPPDSWDNVNRKQEEIENWVNLQENKNAFEIPFQTDWISSGKHFDLVHCQVWCLGEVVTSLWQNLLRVKGKGSSSCLSALPATPSLRSKSLCWAAWGTHHVTSTPAWLWLILTAFCLFSSLCLCLVPASKMSWIFGLCTRSLFIHLMKETKKKLKPAKAIPVSERMGLNLFGGQGMCHTLQTSLHQIFSCSIYSMLWDKWSSTTKFGGRVWPKTFYIQSSFVI